MALPMLLRCLFAAMVTSVAALQASGPALEWIKLLSPTIPQVGTTAFGATEDLQGNIYVAGGPKSGIGKFTADGSPIWSFGQPPVCCDPYITAQKIFVQPDNSIHAFGTMYGTQKLGVLTNDGSYSVFFAKLSGSGTNSFAKRFVWLTSNGRIAAPIPDGGYFVGGGFANQPLTYEGITLSPTDYGEGALFRIANDGTPAWARRFIGDRDDIIDGIASAPGPVALVGGWTSSSVMSGAGITVTNQSGRTVFLLSLDGAGLGKWKKAVGASSLPTAPTSAVLWSDLSSRIYWASDFQGALKLGNSSVNSSDPDTFLARVDSSGNVDWVRTISGAGHQIVRSITEDSGGNIYVAGYFTSELRIDSTRLVSNGAEDLYIAKFKSDGTFLWVKQIGSAGRDMEIGVSFTRAGEMLVVGSIGGGLSLEGTYIEGGGLTDAFLAKFAAEGDAPKITLQPESQVASGGTTVSLTTATAPNGMPPQYQWWFNGAKLTGATNANLTLTNFQTANAGSYYVIAKNASGQAQSDAAGISFTDAGTLALTVHASLTLYGTIGKTYRIDYSDTSATVPVWTSAGTVTILSSPQVWIDTNAAVNSKRIYRTLLQ